MPCIDVKDANKFGSLTNFVELGKKLSLRMEKWKYITRQYICKHCNRHFTETLDLAAANKSYTHRMSKLIHLLCKKQSYAEVGAIVNLSSKTVERSVKRFSFGMPNFEHLRLSVLDISS